MSVVLLVSLLVDVKNFVTGNDSCAIALSKGLAWVTGQGHKFREEKKYPVEIKINNN